MSTQPFTDDRSFKGFFLNLGDGGASAAVDKWRRSDRVFFCAASGILCWMAFVRLAELMIGG
jgi:hypothetical protein